MTRMPFFERDTKSIGLKFGGECIPSGIQGLNFVILLNDGEHSVKRMIHGDEGTEINVYVSNP